MKNKIVGYPILKDRVLFGTRSFCGYVELYG